MEKSDESQGQDKGGDHHQECNKGSEMEEEQASSHGEGNRIFFRIKKEPSDYVGVYVEEDTLHTGPGDWNVDAGLSQVLEDESGVNSDADINGGWEEDGNHERGSDEESNMGDVMEGEVNASHPNFEGNTGQVIQSKFSSASVKKQLLDTNLLAVGPVGMQTEKETFQCSKCQMCFLKKSHIRKHKGTPRKKKLYQCTRCKKAFSSTIHLIEHCNLMMHSHDSACECSECVNSTGNLRKHTSGLERSEEKLYGCALCVKVFSRPKSLRKHVKWHTGRKSFFSCSRCRKGVRTECNLWRHVQTHSEEKTLGSTSEPRASSPEVFYDNISVNEVNSSRTDKNFECITCGKDVDYKCMCYRKHEINTKTGEKLRYACIYCPKDFARLRLLNEHARSHTGAKPYQCSECFQSFVSNCTLKRHMKIHVGEKKYECEYCNRKFSRSAHLADHIRIHTGERPFHCPVCDKWFVTSSHLRNHARNHTGEKPHECVYCEKSFKSATGLNDHILTHPGKNPFTCLLCGKGFSQKQKLKKHCRTHIAKRSFQCTMCSKSFNSNSRRLKHFKSRHDGKSH